MVDISIDMGSALTKIYQDGHVVLCEASCVAFTGGGAGELYAAGDSAARYEGKSIPDVRVSFPVVEGLIVDARGATSMLGYFLIKIFGGKLRLPKIRAIISVPCSATAAQRRVFEETAFQAGVSDIILINSPILCGSGLGVLQPSIPVMIVDMGAGKTEISVICSEGIICGCDIGLGGNDLTEQLMGFIADRYAVELGFSACETLKKQVASLYMNDGTSVTLTGKDLDTGEIRSVRVSSRDVYELTATHYDKLLDEVSDMINGLSPEVSEALDYGGLYLVGGDSQVPGLAQIAERQLEIKISTYSEPIYFTAVGADLFFRSNEEIEFITRLGE